MTKIKFDVLGREIDLDDVPELHRHIALAVKFSADCGDSDHMLSWWNYLPTAREILKLVEVDRGVTETS